MHHCELVEAENGVYGDGYCNSHYSLIKYYQEFTEKHPDYWSGYLYLLDQLIGDGRYEEALSYYEKGLEVQAKPRFIDSLISMVQIYEILGQYDKAIKTLERQINLLIEEHGITSGETINEPKREIERLQKLIKENQKNFL